MTNILISIPKLTKKEIKGIDNFFKDHPRRKFCVVGNPTTKEGYKIEKEDWYNHPMYDIVKANAEKCSLGQESVR